MTNYKTVITFRHSQNRLPVAIMYDPREVWPWTVQYGGGGHYTDNLQELLQYCQMRGFIRAAQIPGILKQCDDYVSREGG